MADVALWLDEEGNLLFENRMILLCDRCPCECVPRILAKYILKPGTVWDLTPYQVEGFAGEAPYRRKWLIRETTGGMRYQSGEIDNHGTLIDLPSYFQSRYDYIGYMTLLECCVDDAGNLVLPTA